jgi:GNAT superfamily N-acetyltransferase
MIIADTNASLVSSSVERILLKYVNYLSHMDINIRLAVDTDLDALSELYFEFHEFHARHLPKYLRSLGELSAKDREELLSKIAEVIKGNDSAILVAIDMERVIGLAEVYLKHPDPADRGVNPAPYAYLQSLAITESYRRRGIGSQLLRAAEEWAREHGVTDLVLGIWEFPKGPLEFYLKAGYHVYRQSLAKDL